MDERKYGLKCRRCGHVAPSTEFYSGRGRHVDEHPDHHYCPNCHRSITWHGYTWVPLVCTASPALHQWAKAAN